MILIVSFLLALVPLIGIAWIFLNGLIFTVDGLFMGFILLTISGICGTTGLYELRKRRSASAPGSTARSSQSAALKSGGLVQRGKVQSVEFYESSVGQPNKSIVTLANNASSPVMLVFEGDLRNALPVGQKVEVTLRKESGYNVLMNVNYA